MDPAQTFAAPPPRPRRSRFWPVIIGSILMAGGIAVVVGWQAVRMLAAAARAPWAELHAAAVAVQTDAGSAGFYRGHPRLVAQFPNEGDFVAAGRTWRSKLAGFPPAPPELWSLLKERAQMNLQWSNGQLTFSIAGYHGLTARLTMRDGALTSLSVAP